ncbi:hypothetical protein [Phyllobacterium salinisoli]|uniref:hypothetical protein n=1 Tax=Phyllobacterium salinisoli TaxID=1899321 RepID=UPI001FE22764|nr:hypothetical protein [Phyllobacterium salinisoli]
MNQGVFLMPRLDNVRGELSLTALAYNIRRAITLVGVPSLIVALRASNAPFCVVQAQKKHPLTMTASHLRKQTNRVFGQILPLFEDT